MGSPVYTLKLAEDISHAGIFACAGERGKIFIANANDPVTTDIDLIQYYNRMYYKDFPRNHVEVD